LSCIAHGAIGCFRCLIGCTHSFVSAAPAIDLAPDVIFFAADDMFACACADPPDAIDANTSATPTVNTATTIYGVVVVVVINSFFS